MDTISIAALEVKTHIGVPEEERAKEQSVWISIDMSTDTKKAATSDNIADSIDYDHVIARVEELAAVKRKTLEAFAEDIATMILKEYSPSRVHVSVYKKIIPQTESVSVSITRP